MSTFGAKAAAGGIAKATDHPAHLNQHKVSKRLDVLLIHRTALERKAIFAALADRALAAQTIPPDLARVLRELFAAVENDEPDAGYVRLLAWTVLSRTARAMRFHDTAPREDGARSQLLPHALPKNCARMVKLSSIASRQLIV